MTRAAVLLTAALAVAADWPQFLGPNRDSTSAETITPWTAPPKVLWKQPCGAGYSGPSVAGGKVFLPDFMPTDKLPEGGFAKGRFTGQERLVCRDAATGKELWVDAYPAAYTISYPGGPRCQAGSMPVS